MPPSQTDTQRRAAELASLTALATALNRSNDVREAMEGAIRHVVALMGSPTGWISLRDETGAFRLVARFGLPPAIDYPGQPWKDTCTCQEQCLGGQLIKPVTMVPCSRLRYAVGDKRGMFQHATVQLRMDEETLGILNVATTEYGSFTAAQQQMLSTAALMISAAIARIRLHEQVKIRQVQEQAALLQLSQDLLDTSGADSALQRLVRVGARLLAAEACACLEADEQAGCARLLAAHGWRYLPPGGMPLVVDAQNPHLWYLPERSADLANDSLDTLPQLLASQRFTGHLAQEVRVGGAPVGLLMVNTRSPRHFSDDEVQLMALLAAQAAQAMERERLQQESNERQRLERELGLARDIQASFLPDSCPLVPGYDVAAFYRAARQVGGDFYDFIALDGKQPTGRRGALERLPLTGRFGVVIADVTDKGVPAALFMALSRTVLRATAIDGRPANAVLETANRLILSDARSGLFVTTFYGILEPATGEFRYANGGHNYPLLLHADTGAVEELAAQGLVLGVMPDPRFEERSVHIQAGDVLVLYTDGVTEAMNRQRHMFGEDRLADVLRTSKHLPAEQIIERLLATISKFTAGTPQLDDITLVVIKSLPN